MAGSGLTPLDMLAQAAGLQRDWTDAGGRPHRVSDAALEEVLDRLGLPVGEASVRLLGEEAQETGFLSADRGMSIRLPEGVSGATAELVLEDGASRSVALEVQDGVRVLPGIDTIGYHDCRIGTRTFRLAVAPPRCFNLSDAAPGRRIWAPAVQISALRDARDNAFGDFGTLAEAARAFGRRGADAIAISPVHALFPADAGRYSPYAPSSRLFLNVLYADPALAGGATSATATPPLIDWQSAIPQRLRDLRAAYIARTDAVRADVADFTAAGGDDLVRHACFDALHAHFFETGARGWGDWPAAYHDPASPAVARFAAENTEEIGFYLFLQWLARRSLDAAQQSAKNAGMAIGLIADLAVGMDGGGSHGWSRRGDLLHGLSIGAPPDPLGPDGQGWGITSFAPRALRRTHFAPFIATIRAALASAGGIRIDHALGLRRLWVIPDGRTPADGAYLTMPLDELLRILAIESHRARAIVIGEDLGTVPEGLRPKLEARAVMGMQVLWFERDREGGFVAPSAWKPDAAAMTGTHDLPTVAGWWQERDIDWAWRLGRSTGSDREADDRAARAADRTRLWDAFVDAGVTTEPEPPRDESDAAVDAALAFVGVTPAEITILPMEDVAGLVEQPNLPGTIDEHPNWRRRMPAPTETMLAEPMVAARLTLLNKARTS